MKSQDSIDQYQRFENTIAEFRRQPTEYPRRVHNRLTRQMHNALPAFLFWLATALLLNLLAGTWFTEREDKADAAAVLALCALALTIAARSYTVNHLLYHSLGRLGRLHGVHYVSERIGFLHRFMALSTLLWLGVHAAERHYAPPYGDEALLLGLLLALVVIIASASTPFRRRHHNHFENIHRYVGYLAVILLIAYLLVDSTQSAGSPAALIDRPQPYLVAAIVMMLIAPWIGVREAHPALVHVGPHVIGMRLPGAPSFGTYTRCTLANRHFHPFGDSMIDFDDTANRVLYITPSGDRTTEVVNAARAGDFMLAECTTRADRFKGFMYHLGVYDDVLIVVTGGGIAPVIPCLVLNTDKRINVLWLGRNQAEEFTEELLGKLLDKIAGRDINIHMLNTNDPDLRAIGDRHYTALILQACAHYRPQAVFVMSNQKFTIDVMHALRENGIKAYGATFDS